MPCTSWFEPKTLGCEGHFDVRQKTKHSKSNKNYFRTIFISIRSNWNYFRRIGTFLKKEKKPPRAPSRSTDTFEAYESKSRRKRKRLSLATKVTLVLQVHICLSFQGNRPKVSCANHFKSVPVWPRCLLY